MDITAKRILIVDDDFNTLVIISNILKTHNYSVITSSTGKEAIELFKKDKPDLILLDNIMPDINGYDILQLLRDDYRYTLTPIIMLTEQSENEDKLKGLEMGADDYILKPFDERELVVRVKNTLIRLERSRGANPLTGLHGNNDIEMEIAYRLTIDKPFSVLYLDLNSFKPYNDVYGFGKGDIAIKMTADIIAQTVVELGSETDFIGHIGGDDFVVILEPESAVEISETIIKKFDKEILKLYTPEDIAKGYITATDRMGNIMKFRLIGIAIAIVNSDYHKITGTIHLSEVAALIKKKAKYIADGRSAYTF